MNISIISVQKNLQKISATIAVLAMVFSPFANVQLAQASQVVTPKTDIDICHATKSQSNPYTSANASRTADVQGHDGHNGPVWFPGITVEWGDIIPPFTNGAISYPGKNWTAAGQAILNNGCEVTKLTLLKTVINNNGGAALDTAFTLVATGPTNTSGIEGSAAVTNKLVTAGAYTLSETGGPAGYTASTYSCVKNNTAAVVSNTITLAKGDVAVCTITNDDQSGTLTVNKVFVGGTKTAADFSFQVNNGSATAFEADASNALTVNAGTYSITEVPVTDYTASYSNCSNVAVSNGGSATCTVTNTYVPPVCPQGYTGVYPACVPPVIACAAPYTGNQPNCIPPPCPQNYTGTYPTCVPPVVPCAAPYTGNQPNCIPPPCPINTIGTYPDCADIIVPCDAPYTGNQPNCVPPPCPQGYTGTYPTCVPPVVPCAAPYTGNQPNCIAPACPDGYTGIYPACVAPVTPCPLNYTGTYPNCVPPPCPQGYTGTYPTCVPPVVNVCPQGYTGTYPDCVPPPSCPQGYTGIYPACVPPIVVTPKQCIVSSDTTTLGNTVPSVLTFMHPAWTTTLSTTSSQWIWDLGLSQTATFTKSFNVDNAPTGSVLRIAVDNSYTAKLNGVSLTCDGSGIGNFGNPIDTCSAPVVSGVNTLEVVAQNFGGPNTNDGNNPAGLIYELVINGSSCSQVPPARKHHIEGYKFNDVNGDGSKGEYEPYLSGWTITLFNSSKETSTTTVTGENGHYSFDVADGNYQVTEVQQSGWEQTATLGNGADGNICFYSLDGESDGQHFCTFGNHQISVAQCISKGNLLVNGSFEDPVVTGGSWGLFASMTGWVSSSLDGFELWKGLYGTASDGLQNVELDVNAPTAISQKIATVIGNVYKVSFDFAARPDRNLADNQMNVLVDGTVVGTVGADGSAETIKNWVTYSYAFTAASTTTEVTFSDIGTANGLGTLLDNSAVCLTRDNTVVTYPVYGYVWNDADQDGPTVPEQEVGETSLGGWTVTATNGETTYATTTRSNGYYLFNLPAGTWTISDGSPTDWTQTYPINVGNVHVVTVPEVVALTNNKNIFARAMDMLIPTAYAQVFLGYGPFNFGNFFTGGATSNGGGGGRHHSTGGSSTPTQPAGQVLGASTSTLPVGAPNTGDGGTSPVNPVLPTMVAVLSTGTTVRKSK